jgi:hypothetical protein
MVALVLHLARQHEILGSQRLGMLSTYHWVSAVSVVTI